MSFYTEVLQPHPLFHSESPIRDIALLEPEFRRRVEAIIAAAATDGVTLRPLETYRSIELQQAYFERGVTKLRTVGVHHYGLACDLGIVEAGQVNWKADYSVLGKYACAAKVVWGGDWGAPTVPHSFRDMDHVQRITVGDQEKLFDGSWYPDDSYEPAEVG
jgi:hypothetical protein